MGSVLILTVVSLGLPFPAQALFYPLPPEDRDTFATILYFPLAFNTRSGPAACSPIPGETYGAMTINGVPSDRPAEAHADLNLGLRGYQVTDALMGLVGYDGGADPSAPQLPALFGDQRTPAFVAVYRVYDWDWQCNCRSDLLAQWDVTLAELAVSPGEAIRVPTSGYDIGEGYQVLVLYASNDRITLKYTREDNVVSGYTLHVEGICVEPDLLALYESLNATGRQRLPALRGGQTFGRAHAGEIGVAMRDYGTFLDPRSRKDWWRGR